MQTDVKINGIPEDVKALPGAADGTVELFGLSAVPDLVEKLAGFRPSTRTVKNWASIGVYVGGHEPHKLASARFHGVRWTTEAAVRQFLAGDNSGDCFVFDETTLTMEEAAAALRTAEANASRYARSGIHGVRLESARLAGRRLTSREAVERFQQRTARQR